MKNKKQFVKEAKNFLLDLLPRAGQIARRYLHAEDLSIKRKGNIDIVTKADLEVDEFISSHLNVKFPRIPIMTEERVKGNISKYKNRSLLWIVDPIDGTANFSRGDSNFSISVALVEKGEPILGAIFAPISSRLFWATYYDKHSYWNGRRIKVSEVSEINKAIVCTDWSHVLTTRDETTEFLKKVYGHVRQIKILGSAATDLMLFARGGVDIYHHVLLFPWDVAAAGLIAQKAGAKVTDRFGNPWNAFSESVLAANPTLHDKMFTFLNSVPT